MKKNLNWGIMGLGGMAREFAGSLSGLHPIYAAASRDSERASDFQETFSVQKIYSSYEELLSDSEVDIVYIATVNSQHYKNIMSCLSHRKHVLCEKAIWGNYLEMCEAYDLAKKEGLLLCEGMTIYHMPLMGEIKRLMREGVLGKIKFIEAELGSLKEDDPSNRFFSKELGGGAMLDIGTYGLSFVMYFMEGSLTKMERLMSRYPTGVDEMWTIGLKSSLDEIGSVNLTFRAKLPKRGLIAGDKAYITVYNYVRADEAVIVYPDGREERLCAGETPRALEYEIRDIERAVLEKDFSLGCTDCTMKVVKLMDRLLSDAQE